MSRTLLLVGDKPSRYLRLRPRASLAAILDDRADQPLPEKVNSLVVRLTVETLNLRSTMLVNVTPERVRRSSEPEPERGEGLSPRPDQLVKASRCKGRSRDILRDLAQQ